MEISKMQRSSLKSKNLKNKKSLMENSKEIKGSSGNWTCSNCEVIEKDQQIPAPRIAKPIAIVEPRVQKRTPTTSTNASSNTMSSYAVHSTPTDPDWIMLPHTLDVNNDVMSLVSSLSTVVQILTRMTNTAAQELRLHPEREEGFQGLRLLLNYADQMYTTLLQPQPHASTSMQGPESPRNAVHNNSLFNQLFEPMLLGSLEREEESSTDRSVQRSPPFRVVAVSPGVESIDISTGLSEPST